jgi:hypothetical protein
MNKLLATTTLLLTLLMPYISLADTPKTSWYLVATMQGLNADGKEDVFVFSDVKFDSQASCKSYTKDNSWDVVFTLSYAYGAGRDFKELACGEEKNVAHLLPKDGILWKVLEYPIDSNAVLAVKINKEDSSEMLEFLGISFHTADLCKIYYSEEESYITKTFFDFSNKYFVGYEIESFGCISRK